MAKNNQQQVIQTAALAGVVGQVGCVTVLIIVLALGAGFLLDRYLETRPLFLIISVALSVPVTIYATVRVSLAAAMRAQRQIQKATEDETKV